MKGLKTLSKVNWRKKSIGIRKSSSILEAVNYEGTCRNDSTHIGKLS
jgi:hypothetical protein